MAGRSSTPHATWENWRAERQLRRGTRIGREAALMLAHMIREGHRRLAGRYVPGTLRIGESLRLSDLTWRSLNRYAWPGGPRLERPPF